MTDKNHLHGVAQAEKVTAEEWHAVGHARYQVGRASPDNPECCFDYELVRDLLNVIDRLMGGAAQPPAAPVETEILDRLIRTANLLFQNAVGCAAQHHGLDIELNGLPGWLADCKKVLDESNEIPPLSVQRSSAESRYVATEDEVVSLGLTVQGLKAELEKALRRIEGLETLRPVWAQGYTSDSMAAQASSTALAGIWKFLGVNNQTDAMEKLRALNEPQQVKVTDEVLRLRAAMDYACDLLAERTYGSSARSPGHNARLHLETALAMTRPHSPGETK